MFLEDLFSFEGENAREGGRGRERGGQKSPSRLYTDSTEPDAGLELTSHEIIA